MSGGALPHYRGRMASLDSPADRIATSVRHRPRLWVLLGSLVALQFGYPITERGAGWTIVYLLVYTGVIGFGVRVAADDLRHHWPLLVVSACLIAGGVWFAVQQDDAGAQAAMLSGVVLIQLALLLIMFSTLIRPAHGVQTLDLLLVAVCAYLLLGGVFGAGAALMEIAAPGSFADAASAAEPLPWQSLYYGSYVVLATLGFGDVVPVSGWARSLWSFEAVLGILFVAVVIARLVGVGGARLGGRAA